MAELIIFVVAGLSAGAVYSLAGVGLVLTYRTTGVFNFAHGSIAAVAAYVFFTLHVTHGLSWPVAAVLAVLGVGLAMGSALEVLGRALARAPLASRVAATVGLLVAIEAVIRLTHDSLVTRIVPPFLAEGSFEVAGTAVQWSDAITLAISIGATAVLSAVLQRSRTGMSLRALVDDPELLGTAGTSPDAVRRLAWVIGAVMAAAAGVLFAPLLPLDPTQLTLIVVAAFGAAAVGAFRSLWLTLVGGLVIGVGAALATRYLTTGLLAGVASSLPFLVLFVVILVLPRSAMVRPHLVVVRPVPRWYAAPPAYLGLGVVLVMGLALVPSFAGIHLTDWTVALGVGVVLLSLGLLVGTSGQVSLGHAGFAAIGACTLSHLAVDRDVPWFVALLAAGLVAVPIGALLAIPAIRLSGLYLALATFGFGLLLQYMFYTQDFMFGSTGAALSQRRPDVGALAGDRGYYYVALVVALVAVGLVLAVNRSRLGRLLSGVADAPVTLQTSGASINVTRVLVFCISAFLAAVGGAVVGAAQLSSSVSSFDPFLSLTYLSVIVMFAVRAPWNAVLGAAALVLVPSYVNGDDVSTILQLVFGIGVLLVVLVPERWRRLPLQAVARSEAARPTGVGSVEHRRVAPSPGLELVGLTVRFGGLVAVDDLGLRAPTGEITGLIGPNGAGKTTTFNACTGLVRPASGRVLLDGADISRLGPARRARRGLGRTFQRMELFEQLTVRRNVALGAEAVFADANPLHHLRAGPRRGRELAARTAEALELVGISGLADQPVATLSTGQRRLVDLARCLATDTDVLLLDEPASGLDPSETAAFAGVLRRVVAERGTGLLLVEHDLSLVLEVCDRIHVLDFGRLLFSGTPAEVVGSPLVAAAYLGSTEIEELAAAEPVVAR